jgi:hypothetical protein
MHTIALNKAGEVVDEVHVMVNVKDHKKKRNEGKLKLNFISLHTFLVLFGHHI